MPQDLAAEKSTLVQVIKEKNGPDNGFVPSVKNQLTEPMLTQIYVAI